MFNADIHNNIDKSILVDMEHLKLYSQFRFWKYHSQYHKIEWNRFSKKCHGFDFTSQQQLQSKNLIL